MHFTKQLNLFCNSLVAFIHWLIFLHVLNSKRKKNNTFMWSSSCLPTKFHIYDMLRNICKMWWMPLVGQVSPLPTRMWLTISLKIENQSDLCLIRSKLGWFFPSGRWCHTSVCLGVVFFSLCMCGMTSLLGHQHLSLYSVLSSSLLCCTNLRYHSKTSLDVLKMCTMLYFSDSPHYLFGICSNPFVVVVRFVQNVSQVGCLAVKM